MHRETATRIRYVILVLSAVATVACAFLPSPRPEAGEAPMRVPVTVPVIVQVTREVPVTRVVTATPIPTPTATPTPEAPRLWEQVGLDGECVAALAIAADGAIYAGTLGSGHGVFKSTDEGESWTAVNNGLGGLDIYSLAVAPANPSLVYAITDQGVWRSLDGAATWRPSWTDGYGRHVGDMTQIVVGAADASIAYVAGPWDRFFETVDSGASWKEVRYLGLDSEAGGLCYSIAKDVAYLYGASGVHRSLDRGRTWLQRASVGSSYRLTALTAVENEPDTVYVGTVEHGIYKSTDGGGSWVPMNTTLPDQGNGVTVMCLALHPLAPTTVYAVLGAHGLYESTDGGETWRIIDIWCPQGAHTEIITIGVGRGLPGQMYLGTFGSGVWRLSTE